MVRIVLEANSLEASISKLREKGGERGLLPNCFADQLIGCIVDARKMCVGEQGRANWCQRGLPCGGLSRNFNIYSLGHAGLAYLVHY